MTDRLDLVKAQNSIKEAKNLVELKRKEFIRVVRDYEIECPACKNKHKLGELKGIGVEAYVAPYSCTGGDYWTWSEDKYICPSCSAHVRFLSDLKWKVEYDVREQIPYWFRSFMREVWDEYEYSKDRNSGQIVNDKYTMDYLWLALKNDLEIEQ